MKLIQRNVLYSAVPLGKVLRTVLVVPLVLKAQYKLAIVPTFYEDCSALFAP